MPDTPIDSTRCRRVTLIWKFLSWPHQWSPTLRTRQFPVRWYSTIDIWENPPFLMLWVGLGILPNAFLFYQKATPLGISANARSHIITAIFKLQRNSLHPPIHLCSTLVHSYLLPLVTYDDYCLVPDSVVLPFSRMPFTKAKQYLAFPVAIWDSSVR